MKCSKYAICRRPHLKEHTVLYLWKTLSFKATISSYKRSLPGIKLGQELLGIQIGMDILKVSLLSLLELVVIQIFNIQALKAVETPLFVITLRKRIKIMFT